VLVVGIAVVVVILVVDNVVVVWVVSTVVVVVEVVVKNCVLVDNGPKHLLIWPTFSSPSWQAIKHLPLKHWLSCVQISPWIPWKIQIISYSV
jgi:hypothetical protein